MSRYVQELRHLRSMPGPGNWRFPQCPERPDCRERVGALGVDAVSQTVDLVIVAGDSSAIPAATDAARRGMRALVAARVPFTRRLHRALRTAGTGVPRRVTVFTNAEVVCVDGLHRLEAVIVRRLGTGRLIGVNASESHVCGGAKEAPSAIENAPNPTGEKQGS